MAAHHDYYVYVLFRRKPRLEPFYVGMGRGYRWIKHEEEVRTNAPRKDTNEHKKSIIRQMQRAGQDAPKVKVAETLTRSQAALLEILLIAAIGRRPHGPLVNRTDGGDREVGTPKVETHRRAIQKALLGNKHSPERIAKNSESHRGKKASPETKRKMSASHKGKPKPKPPGFGEAVRARLKGTKASAETRAKLSAINQGSLNHFFGRKHTPETRSKMRKAKRNKKFQKQLSFDF